VFVVLFSTSAFALPIPLTGPFAEDVDPFNTYQWNRKNRHSNKVDNGQWYEWWYYKVIDPKTNHKFFFTYGVVNPWDKENTTGASRAFVSFGDFQERLILETQVPVTDFSSKYDTTVVQVGPHIATDKMLMADFETDGHHVSWMLALDKKVGWDAMGWGLMFPRFFNIYWHPAQMYAKFNGILEVDDRIYYIEDADGYQDRNWGRRFPKWWFWMSINSFDENPESAFVGGGGDARTRNGLRLPTAILLALHHKGKLYEFRTSDFKYAWKWNMNLGNWQIEAKNWRYKLIVDAHADPEEMMDLPFHTPEGKVFHDYETLGGSARVQLFRRKLTLGWKKIADLSTADKAGLELGLDHAIARPISIVGVID